MRKTSEEMLASAKKLLGENTSDEAISFLEDLTDSMTPDKENWKEKYEENDRQWRARYRERFFNPEKADECPVTEEVATDPKKPLRYEDLFKEE